MLIHATDIPTPVPPLPGQDPSCGTIHWKPWEAARRAITPCQDCGATVPPYTAQGATQQRLRPYSTGSEWALTHHAYWCPACQAVRAYRSWVPQLGNIHQLIHHRPPPACADPPAHPPADEQPSQLGLF